MKHLVLALALFASIPLSALPAAAQSSRSRCRAAEGTFTSSLVTDPAACDSPIGMCTSGQLEGGMEGTYEFTFLTMMPDPSDPSVVHYTGRSVVTTATGVLYGEDRGVMRMHGDGTASFVTTVEVYAGEGCFAGATGRIVAPGRLDLMTGQAEGAYGAYVCGRAGIQRCF